MSNDAPPKATREPRVIGTQFPYYDLEQASEIATVLHDDLGGTATADQIAAKLGQTATSGAFRLRMSSAAQFGLIARERETYRLTSIGQRLLSAATAPQARVDAFLNIALYRKLYTEFRGRHLPPTPGLESFLRNSGVVQGQTGRARQAFQRSAETAGFFGFGKDRLVLPSGVSESGGDVIQDEPQPDPPATTEARKTVTQNSALHPALAGILLELPEAGATWSEAELEAWSTAFMSVLKVVHRPRAERSDKGGLG